MACRLFACGAVLSFALAPLGAADPDVLRIGFVESLLQESPPTRRKLFGSEFKDLIREFTGFKSVVLQGINPMTAARQINDGKWHLGVFQGVEFAWVQARYPDLRPLMVVRSGSEPIRAVLLVKKEGGATGWTDLRGKDVITLQGKLICRLFTEKATGKDGKYFRSIKQTRNVEEALDSLVRGQVQGAIVDSPSLKFYQTLQPGRFERLKMIAESEPFPPAAIVYHEGTLSKELLGQLKKGMLKVNQSEKGREALSSFRVTGFEEVPKGYQQDLTTIARAYPASEL